MKQNQKLSGARDGFRALACVLIVSSQLWILAGDASDKMTPALTTEKSMTLAPLMFPAKICERGKTGVRGLEHVSGRDVFAMIDAQVEAEMGAYETPGAAIAIVVDHELVYTQGYGIKHRSLVDEVMSTSQFRVGSVSKMLTAAAVMREVDLGRVGLAQPVTDFVPELMMSGDWDVDRITVGHLLTHATGIPDGFEMHCAADDNALSDWAGTLFSTRVLAPAGVFWNYANPNFNLAGLVVERSSGMPFRQYMRDHIFGPAGMSATTLDPQEVMARDDFTYGHQGGRPEFIYSPDGYDCGAYGPSGLVFSTVEDLARWAMLMMAGGGDVLSQDSVNAMQAPQIYLDYYPGYFYGYGVFVEPYQDIVVRHHGGNVPGWGTFLLWVPERGFAVAIIGNTFDSLAQSAFYALDLFLQPNPVDPADWMTDPDTWNWYQGSYQLIDVYGDMDNVEVELAEHMLQMRFLGPPYLAELEQLFLDTFGMDLNGNEVYDWNEVITFIDATKHQPLGSREKHGNEPPPTRPVRWFRNRGYVGQMIGE